jgi:hypothetical protein
MWAIETDAEVLRQAKQFRKKWRREITNVFDNLDTVLVSLQKGVKPEQIKQFGFAHTEPQGVIAIDQKGPTSGGGRLKPFRLYVFPDEVESVLHVRVLGDKDSQSDDLSLMKSFVKGLLANRSRDDS